MSGLRVGQLAKAAGVTAQTIRYYERRQLLAPPPRTGAGYREYPAETLARLRFIRHAQELGFGLDEIGELLSLRADAPSDCAAVEAKVRRAVEQIDGRVEELRRIRSALLDVAARCHARATARPCPLLEELE